MEPVNDKTSQLKEFVNEYKARLQLESQQTEIKQQQKIQNVINKLDRCLQDPQTFEKAKLAAKEGKNELIIHKFNYDEDGLYQETIKDANDQIVVASLIAAQVLVTTDAKSVNL
jgi:hypothetical protein